MSEWSKQSSSRAGTSNVFTTSGTSQATGAFGPATLQIRIATSGQPCWVTVGDGTPTAATTGSASFVMPSNWSETVTVSPGQRAAVLAGGFAASQVTITEMS
jgi:hypothetical protein